ncbi:hypothetical protein GH714_032184 [Hevea brasiliensis]|nr:hypothetical protein GH714_032184 [Hevea brasiliensis]
MTNYASPLPIPPFVVPRSFSIPSSSQRAMTIHVSKSVESLHVPEKAEEVDDYPPLTQSIANIKQASATPELVPHSGQIRVSKVAVDEPSLTVKKKAADISSDLKGTSIFLVGMKSSMKTSLGKLLADALRYYYFDSDSLVEEAAGGASAAKSFRETDEKGFRESETEVLKQLSSMGRLVVCAGDGAVQSSTNLALLRHGISLWVDVPLEMVAREMSEDNSQLPASEMVSGDHLEVLTQLVATYEEMRGGYATADATISLQKVASMLGYDELDSVTTEDMTLEVLKEIEKLTRVKKMMEEAARPF